MQDLQENPFVLLKSSDTRFIKNTIENFIRILELDLTVQQAQPAAVSGFLWTSKHLTGDEENI